MSFLASLSITQRLFAVAVLIGLAFAASAAVTVSRMNDVSRLAESTAQQRIPQLAHVAALELNVTRVSLQLRHAILSRTPTEMAETLADVTAKRAIIDRHLKDYEAGLFTPSGRERFAKVQPVIAEFWRVGEENLALIQAGRKEEAFAFLVDRTIPARNRLLEQLSDTVKYQHAALDQDLDAVSESATQVGRLVLVVSVAAVALLAGLSWHVGALIRRRMSLARNVAERVRDGDLTTQVTDPCRDEVSPLLAALGQMQSRLSEVVGAVRGHAERVASASAVIASGHQDLSSRTEQQASALEQTAATMEELGTTVRHNAGQAGQADGLAQGARAVAVKGGEVVGEVVETMRGISESSRRIAEINATIDGIAFQTNILALNAAVEAARAGEQGRGFAVVAGEVRSLAQRSAEAAKQIKSLIHDSTQRVDRGMGLADDAGRTMREVVTNIAKVTDMVAAISTASAEQSSGVNQVGEAVVQMDRVTQQNAALVQQGVAAAEGLRGQADELVAAVSVFRLPAGVH
jgi:methyl-accepting chemotaxis protein